MRTWFARLVLPALLAWGGCTPHPAEPRPELVSPAPALVAAAPAEVTPAHLTRVRNLVRDTAPDATAYQHSPTVVTWGSGTDGGATCRADCSGLMNELFKHTYELTDADLKAWLRSTRPLARHYYNAIIAERGFHRVGHIDDLQPGDIMAIAYEPGAGNSGHVMVVDAAPEPETRALDGSVLPIDASFWRIHVIDSSRSGHGPGDTRFEGPKRVRNGLGSGYFRVAADPRGTILAHAFGIATTDAWHPVARRSLAIGRVSQPPPRARAVRQESPPATLAPRPVLVD